MRRGPVLRCRVRARAISMAALVAGLLAVAGASAPVAAAAAPTFSAHGSAEQVYVTGLAPNARASLLKANGATLYTHADDSLGGMLFRNVPAGTGYGSGRPRTASGHVRSLVRLPRAVRRPPAPIINQALIRAGAPVIYQQAMGVNDAETLPADPIQLHPTYQSALDAFEALPEVRVLFDNSGLWANASAWQWNWMQNSAGTAISYVSAPLTSNTAVIGAGAIHAWARSSTQNVDLQATISEVRPDGNETFVQNGWLRADERKLDTTASNLVDRKSRLLEPVLSMRPSDVSPMPKDKFVEVVIPLYYEGHAYRAGSRIRVTLSAPNGTQPIWAFSQTAPKGTGNVAVKFSQTMPSSVILPVVPGVSVPTGLPACPSLRNEPCRPYVAIANCTASS